MIRRIVLTLALGSASLARAQSPAASPAATTAAPPEANADRNEVDQVTGEAMLLGNARLSDGTLLLLADEIRYNYKTHIATATGRIQFTRGNVRLLADRLVYNRLDGTFTADNIRLGSHPYFIEGFAAAGTRDEITIQRARASYGEPGPWQPTVNADKIVFSPEKKIFRSENVTAGIGHTQPVPIPRFNHNFSAPLFGTGSLHGGYRRSLGVFAEAALHAPIYPSVGLGADVGIFSERGIMVGPSGRYADPKDPDKLRGYFRSGYINDHGDKGTDNVYDRPVPENRAYAEWHHQQQLTPDLTLTASGHWWKDPEVYRDFRSRSFFPLQEPDTFAEAVYTSDNAFLSFFTRFQPNRFHRVQERLPELRFDVLPHVIGPGFVQRFNASAALLREDPILAPTIPASTAIATATFPFGTLPISVLPPFPPGSGSAAFVTSVTSDPAFGPPVFWARDGFGTTLVSAPSALVEGPAYRLQTQRLDAYYGLERPFAPREWLAITPVAGGRITHYSNSKIGALRLSDYTRVIGEVGLDAALRTSGTFNYQNPQWKIDGLRHLFTPRVSYRYIPDAGKGRDRFPRIDREVFSTYLQPLGLGNSRNIDDLYDTNTLRLALDNILQTRDRTEGTRDLIALNLANDFRFKRRPGERDVSETHVDLALMPSHWLQLDLYQSFAPQTFTLRELNSGITIRDGRAWSLRFSNNFLRRQIEDYLVDGRVRLNERLDFAARLHYDARRRRFNEQTYGIVQNLGNTWLVSYNVSVYSGRRRESSFGFNIQIDTVRF